LTDTIAAIATPPGVGAIAIVRLSGPKARAIGSGLFHSQQPLAHRTAVYGEICDESGKSIDKGLALLWEAPQSYTGEESVEFHTHGSPVVARELLRALLACGARLAEPGEFTQRAFLNGKIDLHEASAVADLIDAQSRSAARAAVANLGGGLRARIRGLRANISSILEELAGAIDFPDEVAEPDRTRVLDVMNAAMAELRELQRTGEAGRLVREGVTVAIVGPPNAGKSSLLNALLGEERALVSEIAGTTRDTIEESITVRGVQMRLIDTAGIRSHADRLEAAGIERTHRALAGARVALVVIDGSQPLTAEARRVLEETATRPRVVVANKADLGTLGAGELAAQSALVGSVNDAATLHAVHDALARAAWNGDLPDLERPHLAAAYELEAVRVALDALENAQRTLRANSELDFIVGDLQTAFAALGHISGDVANEEIVTGVFARFCIGK